MVSIDVAASPPCPLEAPERITQGELVVARTGPGCAVTVDGRAVRVDRGGTFVFGVGRDAREVRIAARGGRSVVRTISPREYRIERVDGVPPSTVTPSPALAARIAREQARVARARERDDPRRDFAAGFVQPATGRVSGVYGSVRVLNGVAKDPHYGLDLAAPIGTPVRAPAAGVVTLAADDFHLTGGTILLDHGHGVSSVFLHLSRIDVAEGRRVAQGDTLGAVGATGRASGPHLHWGLNWFDVRIDPALLLDRARR